MNHDYGQDNHSSNSIGKFVFIGFLLIAGFFLITEHRAHLSGLLYYLPFLFLLACPLMHLFHHRHSGHGGHGREEHEPKSGTKNKSPEPSEHQHH